MMREMMVQILEEAEPERFDLAEQLNDLVNATQDGDEDRAERAQDAIVEAFARVTAYRSTNQ